MVVVGQALGTDPKLLDPAPSISIHMSRAFPILMSDFNSNHGHGTTYCYAIKLKP